MSTTGKAPYSLADIKRLSVIARFESRFGKLSPTFGQSVQLLSWKRKLEQRQGVVTYRIVRCSTRGRTTTYKLLSGKGTKLEIRARIL